MHAHDLNCSIGFYAQLFGTQPACIQDDYAKWMLKDPRVNFAVSTRDKPVGVAVKSPSPCY